MLGTWVKRSSSLSMTSENVLTAFDCINAVWDNGIQEDSLYSSVEQKVQITINTPLGETDPFILENLIKQGTVLGPVLNNCSLDRIPKEGSGY